MHSGRPQGTIGGGGGSQKEVLAPAGLDTSLTCKCRRRGGYPQYANYWAPLTRKQHIPPRPAQPRHTNHWAPRTRKRHQQEHRPQRPTERTDPTQHAKGRTGDCPGPRKGTTTRRNVTRGVIPPPLDPLPHPDRSDCRGEKRNLLLENYCRPIFGTHASGSQTLPRLGEAIRAGAWGYTAVPLGLNAGRVGWQSSAQRRHTGLLLPGCVQQQPPAPPFLPQVTDPPLFATQGCPGSSLATDQACFCFMCC